MKQNPMDGGETLEMSNQDPDVRAATTQNPNANQEEPEGIGGAVDRTLGPGANLTLCM
jgi:hypothetical protein